VTTLEPSTRFGALISALLATRKYTEVLVEPLSEADQSVQSMPDVSPTKWHRAHTTWFFEAFVLGPLGPGYQPFDENFSYLFNSYYEAIGDRYPRPRRGMVTRPGAARIGAYRQAVDEAVVEFLESGTDLDEDQVVPLIELGIHHEQQHQELLLMDIKHVLANNLFDTAYVARPHEPVADPGPMGWLSQPGGMADIGFDTSSSNGSSFHFDNEGPRHQALVNPHQLADRLVTSGEWLEFMADGGYADPKLWLSDGWYTRRDEEWQAPLYWTQSDDGQWLIHTLTGPRPVDPNEPVCHVSFYEADAFATWAGVRLPTEFEWEQAAASQPGAPGAFLAELDPDGSSLLDASPLHPRGAGSPTGELRQLFGDCWEWTGSPNRPYPGYQVPEGAVGEYNGKFMINTMVTRGGSALTPPDHIRTSYRNFFHPHTRWHLSGVRLARD
jgi:ergothioneine biosynthesis protein EgtB